MQKIFTSGLWLGIYNDDKELFPNDCAPSMVGQNFMVVDEDILFAGISFPKLMISTMDTDGAQTTTNGQLYGHNVQSVLKIRVFVLCTQNYTTLVL